MKNNLFFDFDGMKFDTLKAHILYINNRYGINTVMSDYIGYNYHLDLIVNKYKPELNLTRDEFFEDLGKNFSTSIELHQDVIPMKGMCKILPLLSKKYTLWTVTARQTCGHGVIQYLLNKYVPGCISGVHYVWNHSEVGGFEGISKRDFILSVPGKKIAFFDDSPDEIRDTMDIIPSYLFDPRNIYKDIKGVTRIQSWEQIGEIFL
ncbi:MAG: hypothetical protein JJE53_03305 [Candidatus Pacebacteria bacterium]|nr:hypothetical protein [Candidatus Paceibacterota bacterium]